MYTDDVLFPDDDEPVYTGDMDERSEIELTRAFRGIVDQIGEEAFEKIAIQFALSCEDEIRANPANPANELLDRYYADKDWKY